MTRYLEIILQTFKISKLTLEFRGKVLNTEYLINYWLKVWGVNLFIKSLQMGNISSRSCFESVEELMFQLASLELEAVFFLLMPSHCLPTGEWKNNNTQSTSVILSNVKALSQPAPPLCRHGSCNLEDMLSPLLCDRASCRMHSQQLPIKGNPDKTASGIYCGFSWSQSLAINNTWKGISSCQGGLQRGWGSSVGTLHLASVSSAHSRS